MNQSALRTIKHVMLVMMAGCGDFAADPPAIFAPYHVSALPSLPDQVVITWEDANAHESGYLVEYSEGAGTYRPLLTTAPDATVAIHNGAKAGVEYLYRVSACIGTRCSPPVQSAPVRFYLPAQAGPATSALNVTATSATFTAEVIPLSDATQVFFEYDVDRVLLSDSAAATAPQTLPAGTQPVAVTAEVIGLRPATEYFYRIVAVNAGGTAHGPTRSFRTLYRIPFSSPRNLTVHVGSSSSFSVSWQDARAGETFFRLEVARADAAFETLVDVPVADWIGNYFYSYIHSGVDQSNYHFRVKACNPAGCSTPTPVVTSTTSGIPRPDWLDFAVVPDSTFAVVNVTLNPNGWPSSGYIEVTATDGTKFSSPVRDLGAGRSAVIWTDTIRGLRSGIQYTPKAVVTNQNGVWPWTAAPFTTLWAPPPDS